MIWYILFAILLAGGWGVLGLSNRSTMKEIKRRQAIRQASLESMRLARETDQQLKTTIEKAQDTVSKDGTLTNS